MVENYTKDLKESVYHSAVISALAVGYNISFISNLPLQINTVLFVNITQRGSN